MKAKLAALVSAVFCLGFTGCETSRDGLSGSATAPPIEEALFVGMLKQEVVGLLGAPQRVDAGKYLGSPAEVFVYQRTGPDQYAMEGVRTESVPYYNLSSQRIEYRDVTVPEQVRVETEIFLELTFIGDELVHIEQNIRRRKVYN